MGRRADGDARGGDYAPSRTHATSMRFQVPQPILFLTTLLFFRVFLVGARFSELSLPITVLAICLEPP